GAEGAGGRHLRVRVAVAAPRLGSGGDHVGAALLTADDVVRGDDHGGPQAFDVLAAVQFDGDVVPGGQSTGDEQTHAPGGGHLLLVGAGQHPVGPGELFLAHPDALVEDVDDDVALAGLVPGDGDRGVGGGEVGGVVHQLRHQPHHVTGGVAAQLHRRQGLHGD